LIKQNAELVAAEHNETQTL